MPRIAPETLEQIAQAINIVDLIGSYFPLKRAGSTYKALCPFHQERSPSFTVNPQRQIFKCFGCGAGGNVFRFVMDYEHVEFGVAARRLAEKAGIRLVEEEFSAEDQARVSLRRRLLALHAAAADWYHRLLMRSRNAEVAREYLKQRGLSAEVAKAWRIGYAPEGWDHFGEWARSQGFTGEEVLASGLVTQKEDEQGRPTGRSYDRFRHRIMFPICNAQGEVIAFSGRVLEAEAKGAKYVNSPETILFTKGAVLFGLHRTMRPMINEKAVIVFEGQIDLITAFEAGIQNGIASQGTAFTGQHAHLLKRYVETVVLCFDADNAGLKAAERSLPALLGEGLSVRLMQMPPGEDPDSFIRKGGAAPFQALVQGARDFFEAQVERLVAAPEYHTAQGRTAAVRKVAEWVSLISDSLLRQSVTNQLTARLGISNPDFARLLKTSRPAGRREEAAPPPKVDPVLADPTLRLMAGIALQDEDGRAWLREAPWGELLEAEPDSALLARILGGDFTIGTAASLSAFLASLSREEEAAVSTLLEERLPEHPLMVASDCWNEIARRQIRRHIEALQAHLRTPHLSPEETREVTKEILDQQRALLNIARPLSPPL